MINKLKQGKEQIMTEERVYKLKTEDMIKGNIVTVLHGAIYGNEQEDGSYKGKLLKIKAINYPYIVLIECDDDYAFSLDLRKWTLGKLSKEYIREMTQKKTKKTKKIVEIDNKDNKHKKRWWKFKIGR